MSERVAQDDRVAPALGDAERRGGRAPFTAIHRFFVMPSVRLYPPVHTISPWLFFWKFMPAAAALALERHRQLRAVLHELASVDRAVRSRSAPHSTWPPRRCRRRCSRTARCPAAMPVISALGLVEVEARRVLQVALLDQRNVERELPRRVVHLARVLPLVREARTTPTAAPAAVRSSRCRARASPVRPYLCRISASKPSFDFRRELGPQVHVAQRVRARPFRW